MTQMDPMGDAWHAGQAQLAHISVGCCDEFRLLILVEEDEDRLAGLVYYMPIRFWICLPYHIPIGHCLYIHFALPQKQHKSQPGRSAIPPSTKHTTTPSRSLHSSLEAPLSLVGGRTDL